MAKKDLFGRGEHNQFTFFDKRKKLIDWESDVAEGNALSTFIMKGNNVAKDAPKILKNMLGVIGLKKNSIRLSKEKSTTKFQVPLEMILDEEGNYTRDLHDVDNFFGACIQRAALVKNITREEYATMIGATDAISKRKRGSATGGQEDKIYNLIKSCIYQEMADKNVADKFPGYLKFVQKNKKSLFEDRWKGTKPGASNRTRFLDTLIRMLRYPSSVTDDEISEFGKYLNEVEKQVKSIRGGFPKNQSEADKMVRSLYKIVHTVENEPPPPPDGGPGDPDEDSEDDGDSSNQISIGIKGPSSDDQQDNDDEQDDDGEKPDITIDMSGGSKDDDKEEEEEDDDSGDSGSGNSDEDEEESEEDDSEEEGDGSGESDEDKEESDDGSDDDSDEEKEEDQDLKDLLDFLGNDEPEDKKEPEPEEDEQDKFDQELFDALKDLLDIQTSQEDTIDQDIMNEFEENSEEQKSSDVKIDYNKQGVVYDGNTIWKKSETDRYTYEDNLKTVPIKKAHVLRNLFTMKNEDYKFSMKSMKSGKFDVSKIVEAKAGVPTVYERMGSVKTDQICIVVLVDESASMSSSGPRVNGRDPGTKISLARKASIYINEVFSKVPGVELFIYGHTEETDSYNTVRVYREEGYQTDPHALGSIRGRGCNRDGEAILACAKRVRSKTDKNGIYMVISDGQPSGDNYSGQEAIAHTRQSVKAAEKLGFQVVQIAIDSRVPSEQMFTNFVKFNDISTLPADLVRFMSRKVTQLMKEKITF